MSTQKRQSTMRLTNPTAPASAAQLAFITQLAEEVPGTEQPTSNLTMAEASEPINKLKATRHMIWKVQEGYR